ncbi:hypothetical protein [Pelagicoccus mobilis]|uniref:Uncharacterized protein n=1 Tax=Pelagicoccus mobilis TaxID=415221 RepID=A0A934VJG7_9BACT|nr:hypothetical protein [Pelagicoccus mobilis]MBK1875601.1 hypothetical protein [Pelagicoccus mobilis]
MSENSFAASIGPEFNITISGLPESDALNLVGSLTTEGSKKVSAEFDRDLLAPICALVTEKLFSYGLPLSEFNVTGDDYTTCSKDGDTVCFYTGMGVLHESEEAYEIASKVLYSSEFESKFCERVKEVVFDLLKTRSNSIKIANIEVEIDGIGES